MPRIQPVLRGEGLVPSALIARVSTGHTGREEWLTPRRGLRSLVKQVALEKREALKCGVITLSQCPQTPQTQGTAPALMLDKLTPGREK